jgi:hypothetical protein
MVPLVERWEGRGRGSFSSGADREIPRAIYGMVIEILRTTGTPVFAKHRLGDLSSPRGEENARRPPARPLPVPVPVSVRPRDPALSLFFLDGITRDAPMSS